MDPRDRIAVVTGAAGGIGGALVRALVDAGARTVVATDLRSDGIAAGDRVIASALDVGDEAATLALVEQIERDHGPIDLWFANAGLAVGGGADATDERWANQWRVNVMSHVYAARALLPGWIARGEGHLVTTASMAGLLTSLGDGVYAATKHAAIGFAEWLAITHADQGVSVSCVCPGAVDTAMLRGSFADAKQAAAVIGGGDVLSPDDAAAAVIAGVTAGDFLIYTHPPLKEFVERKASDTDRWIRGMSRLWARSRETLADNPPTLPIRKRGRVDLSTAAVPESTRLNPPPTRLESTGTGVAST